MAVQGARMSGSGRSGPTHAQGHSHVHDLSKRGLRIGFFVTLFILVVEVVGGVFAHSLALFSDAGHVLTDAVALGLAWFAAVQAERPASGRRTFGYLRVGILTALVNGLSLVLIAGVIVWEALHRLTVPEPVQPAIMIAAAAVGVLANAYIAFGLNSGHAHSLNTRAALLHVIGDIGASLAVIVGAGAIVLTGAQWIDPVLSLAISVLIAFSALRILRETVSILLESAPRGLDVAAVARDMESVRGVEAIHDLHIWTITSGVRALSCHAVIADIPPSASAKILDQLTDMLRSRYQITHTTIQFESTQHTSHEGFCACSPDAKNGLYCDLRNLPDCCDHEHSEPVTTNGVEVRG